MYHVLYNPVTFNYQESKILGSELKHIIRYGTDMICFSNFITLFDQESFSACNCQKITFYTLIPLLVSKDGMQKEFT